ncbi:unnamed protein product [Amaranthus hypochondriacus]
METVTLRQLLNHICTDSQWSYAVFWKLHQFDNFRLFVYEDGYCNCDSQKLQLPRQVCNSMQEAFITSGLGTNFDDVHFLRCPLCSAVAAISHCQYLLGEGMVGRVALAETDIWIDSDNAENDSFLGQDANEWLLPIAAGIKTTLLAPVLPYGVLQVGSFEKVDESLAIGADIRDSFFTLACATISPFSNHIDPPSIFSSNLIPDPENTDQSSFFYNNIERTEYQNTDISFTEFIENELPTACQLVPSMFGNFQLEDFPFLIDDQNVFYPYSDINGEPDVLNEFVADIPEATEMWMFSCLEEHYYDTQIPNLTDEIDTDFVSEQEKYSPISAGSLNESRNSKEFPRDYELQEALVPAFRLNDDRDSWNSSPENAYSDKGFGSLTLEFCGPTDEDVEQEYLLEDVLAKSYSNQCNISKSVTSLNEKTPLFQFQHSCEPTPSVRKHDIVSVQGQFDTLSENQSIFAESLPSPSSFESLESATIKDDQRPYCSYELLGKNAKTPKLTKGKEKPKNSGRPRPRDRQLIQDRLKELRMLVPGGEKSSIDGLLDQATKHMNFLKTVSEHAEKVKNIKDQEVHNSKKLYALKSF